MTKSNIIALLITLIFGVVIFLVGFTKTNYDLPATENYQVYLDGAKIGVISDQNELYTLINNEQASIKEQYQVEQVYPPKGFEIEKVVSYNDETTSAESIYNQIKDKKEFTVKGYVITVSSEATAESDAKVLFKINVLDKQVFEDAIKNVITSFITEDKYNRYINNTQEEITTTGEKIENIYFSENISVKEAYISTEEKIYTSSDELSKYLLFGDNAVEKTYTVKAGDTIAKIASANELNVSEFLVANPQFKSENDMLAVGENVTISLINPKLTLVYDVFIVEDVTINYDTVVKYDYSKSSSYRNVETKGENGIERVAKRTQIINGDANQGAVIDQSKSYTLKEAVDEVIIRGQKSTSIGYFYDDGTNWAWPTNYPYTISSPFGNRTLFNRTFHDGVDITGTGYGSPIYAISDGIVRSAQYGGMVGSSAGYNVVIEHPNGYWSIYAHLSKISVSVGDSVSRKQKIGEMGKSGTATGTHLHLGISIGKPYNGGLFINPLKLWQ